MQPARELARARPSRHGAALLEAGGLVLFQLLLLQGFRAHLDLGVADEAQYLRQGRLLAEGRWSDVDYAWSLPLAALHALLGLLGVAVRHRPDALLVGCALASSLGLWWGLRPLLARPAAFLAACWWAASSTALHLEGLEASSYALGLTLVSAAVGLVARGRPWAALAVMAVAALNRVEIALWLVSAGALWLVARRRGGRPVPLSLGAAYLTAGAALLALFAAGWRARARSWFAFRQHFAWGHPKGASAAEAFPGADSVLAAARADPEAFIAHVARSAADLPRALAELVFDVAPWLPELRFGLVASVAALAAWGVAHRIAQRAERPPVDAARLFLVASASTLAAPLVLLPRPGLLLPLLPLALGTLFGAAAEAASSLARRVPARVRRSAAGLAPVLVVLVAALPGATPFLAPAGEPPHRAAVALLREHRPSGTLLAARAAPLALYAELDDVEPIDPLAPSFLATHGPLGPDRAAALFAPDHVLETPRLHRWRGFAAWIDGGGWRVVASRAQVRLLERVR